MTSLDEILVAAQSLPPSDRAFLITALWDKLSPDEWAMPSEEWIAEANRRSDALDRGELPGTPWSEVRQRVRRKAGLDG